MVNWIKYEFPGKTLLRHLEDKYLTYGLLFMIIAYPLCLIEKLLDLYKGSPSVLIANDFCCENSDSMGI